MRRRQNATTVGGTGRYDAAVTVTLEKLIFCFVAFCFVFFFVFEKRRFSASSFFLVLYFQREFATVRYNSQKISKQRTLYFCTQAAHCTESRSPTPHQIAHRHYSRRQRNTRRAQVHTLNFKAQSYLHALTVREKERASTAKRISVCVWRLQWG